jgi:hypothetical protein
MVVITQSIAPAVAEVLTAEPDQLRIWVREVANLQHQVIGEVDAQDGRSAVGDRPLVSEQWTSVPIRSRAASVGCAAVSAASVRGTPGRAGRSRRPGTALPGAAAGQLSHTAPRSAHPRGRKVVRETTEGLRKLVGDTGVDPALIEARRELGMWSPKTTGICSRRVILSRGRW